MENDDAGKVFVTKLRTCRMKCKMTKFRFNANVN